MLKRNEFHPRVRQHGSNYQNCKWTPCISLRMHVGRRKLGHAVLSWMPVPPTLQKQQRIRRDRRRLLRISTPRVRLYLNAGSFGSLIFSTRSMPRSSKPLMPFSKRQRWYSVYGLSIQRWQQ